MPIAVKIPDFFECAKEFLTTIAKSGPGEIAANRINREMEKNPVIFNLLSVKSEKAIMNTFNKTMCFCC